MGGWGWGRSIGYILIRLVLTGSDYRIDASYYQKCDIWNRLMVSERLVGMFLTEIKPRLPTSKQVRVEEGLSLMKWTYLSIFFPCQVSMFSSIEQVSSNRWTALVTLFMRTRSGFRAVTAMEPPPGACTRQTSHCQHC